MPEEPSPAEPAAPRRTLRTYARREDAEQARAVLADQAITAAVDEHFLRRPTTGERVSAGCSLTVAVADSTAAARVLLRMPPSEPAGKREAPAPPMPNSPLRRRVGQRTRQKSPLPLIVVAVVCSALGIFWMVRQAMSGPYRPPGLPDESPGNVIIREDLNWDGEDDSIREYSPGGLLLSMQEDRNYDGLMDVRWIWQRNQLTYRDRDLDFDGQMDERTTFDAYNEPFYVDLRWRGKGPVVLRRVFREGVLWKILEDEDGDTHFDRLRELAPDGSVIREETLPKDSPENAVPQRP